MAGPPTLLLSALFAIAAGAIYVYVGKVVHRRDVEGDARLAAQLFAMFWYVLGAITAGGSITTLAGWAGAREPALFLTLTHAVLLLLFAALWALLYYFVYLFLGSRKLLWPVTAFYVGMYVWTLYLIASQGAATVETSAWTVRLRFSAPLDPSTWQSRLFGVLLIAPPIIGAIAYARLFFQVDTPTQRYRIGMVAGTIIAWFSTSLIASVLQLGQAPWWQITSRIIGVAAAAAIYFAYRPPQWVRRRYGIHAIDDPAAPL